LKYAELWMKQRLLEGFGQRLTQIRRSRGVTQTDLADAVGVSKRVIAYYEQDDAQPPGALLVDLARALQVSTDELLGIKMLKKQDEPKRSRLMKRLARIELLPPPDQRAVLKFLEALLENRGVDRKAS
jgi:transcriptional regulator with XRE-family HTH domain